jgi:hypothetical protein
MKRTVILVILAVLVMSLCTATVLADDGSPALAAPAVGARDFSRIDAILDSIRRLVDGIVAKPAKPIGEYSTTMDYINNSPDTYNKQSLSVPAARMDKVARLSSVDEKAAPLKLKKAVINYDYSKGYFDDPQVFTFDTAGHMIFADFASSRIVVLNGDNTLNFIIGGPGDGDGQFRYISALAVDRKGRIIAADSKRAVVQVFDSNGKFAYKLTGALSEKFKEPVSMAVSRASELFVLDRKLAKVFVFDIGSGKFIREFGGAGQGKGRFSAPSSITMDRLGFLFIADTNNDRIQVFTKAGNYVSIWNGVRFPIEVSSDQYSSVFVLSDTIKKMSSISGKVTGEWHRKVDLGDGQAYYLGQSLYPTDYGSLLVSDLMFNNILEFSQQ